MKESFGTPQNIEQQIDTKLRGLPQELREKWEKGNEDKSPEEQLTSLTDLLERRKKTRRESTLDRQVPQNVPLRQDSPLAVSKILAEIESGEHKEIGAGKAARVITSITNPEKICYKVMFPSDHVPPVPPETNSISVETEIQESVYELGEMYGVRTPAVYWYIKNEVRAIAMERVHGPTLKEVLSDKAETPEKFDAKTFITSLSKYIEFLHENGYYHRDLHEGNILVDSETGMPWVIDYGASVHLYSHTEEDPYRKEIIKNGKKITIVLPSDTENVKRIARTLSSFKS